MKNAESIKNDFSLLGIREQDYPPYQDPETFARNIKRCTLRQTVEVVTSANTITIRD